MFNVDQLPFLYTLGYAIGHSLWQMSLIWLAYTGITSIHKWNSSQRYNFAVVATFAGFASFLITVVYFNIRAYNNELVTGSSLDMARRFISTENRFFYFYHSFMASLISLAPYFSCAYLSVMMLLTFRLANGFKQVSVLKNKGISKAPVEWRLFVNNHAGLLGISKKVALHVSNIASSPLTIGFLKPVILLPLASINQLTPIQLEAILLHELAHIKRNDYLYNILLQVAEIVLFFNPFMRLILKQARTERENCCDDYVLQFRYNAADYAKALISIEQQSTGNFLALGTNNKNEFQLLNRVKRMLSPERRTFNYKQQLALLFFMTLITIGFTVLTPKKEISKESAQKTTVTREEKNVSYESVIPGAMEFVKNFERLGNNISTPNTHQEETSVLAFNGTKHLPAHVIQKHVSLLEKDVNELYAFDDGYKKAITELSKQEDKIPGIINNVWENKIDPAINTGIKIFSEKGIGAINQALLSVSESTRGISEKQRQEIAKVNLEFTKNAKKIEELTELKKAIHDSLRIVFSNDQIIAWNNSDAMKKAKKQLAIAPFRILPDKDSRDNLQSFYSFPNKEDELQDDELNVPVAPMASLQPPVVHIDNRDHKNQRVNPKQKTITIFDEKQISEKVKQAWDLAQQQMKLELNADLQQKVLDEIQHELQGIENVQIKAHIKNTSSGKTRSYVIEVAAE